MKHILSTLFISRTFLNKKIHDLLIHTFRNLYNITLNRLFLSTFENLFYSISNVSFVGKLRAQWVVVGTELCSHFLVAHEVGFKFLRILILGLDFNWRNVRLGELVFHYIEFQVFLLFDLLRQQRLNLRLRWHDYCFFTKAIFFGLINSHIRTGRFRGSGGICDRGVITAKRTVRRNY